MKQLTVISGKGGTGKTTIAAALAALAEDVVMADCDVDAADLHLILSPDIVMRFGFIGSKVASIDDVLCTKCGICRYQCRFGAINGEVEIEEFECEGCGVCEYVCPRDAISMVDRQAGEAYISKTRFGPMSHAKLGIGEESSGKLVSVVRDNARKLAQRYGNELLIVDGPPGTGCSVIASITGSDLVLIVTEPSMSGIHDLERVLEVADHFNIPSVVCINKWDINEENSRIIEDYCMAKGIDVIGKLLYGDEPVNAMMQNLTVIEHSDGEFSKGVRKLWDSLGAKLT